MQQRPRHPQDLIVDGELSQLRLPVLVECRTIARPYARWNLQRRTDDLIVGVDGVELGIGQRPDEQPVQLRCGVVKGRGDPELQPGIRCPIAGRLVGGRHHRRVSAIDVSGGAGPLTGCSIDEGIDEGERVTQSRERVAREITVTSDRMPDCGICELQQDSAPAARDEGSLRADVGEAAGGRWHKPTVRGVAVPSENRPRQSGLW